MKKYPKLVQCDKRGQIVIPKDLRAELGIDEGTGFWMYAVSEEGILLKKLDAPEIAIHKRELDELRINADKLKLKRKNIDASEKKYKKTTKGKLELI